jgi:hypothetical protein
MVRPFFDRMYWSFGWYMGSISWTGPSANTSLTKDFSTKRRAA